MQWKEAHNQYVIRLDCGEPVVETLKAFCLEANIGSASIQGIGGLKNLEYGVFDPEKGAYSKFQHKGFVELITLSGNITWVGQEPFVHCHFMAAEGAKHFVGGHLFEAMASITVEIFVRSFDERIEREFDPNANFKVMQLSKTFKTSSE